MVCGKALCGQTISYTDPFQLTAVTFTLDASPTDGKPSYTGTGVATDGMTYTYRLRWCSVYNPQQGKTTGAWILGSDQDANVACNSGNPYWINQSTTNAPPPTSGKNDGWFYPLNQTGGNTGLVLSGSGLFGLSTVTTVSATNILAITATLGGSAVIDGGQTITDKGIVYGASANPTTSNNKVSMGTGTAAFSQTVSGLSPSTTYHYRAYSINASGTSYGADQTFTTLTPTITSNITTVTMPGTTYGTASANGSFTVSGAGMAAGISVTPSSGFEVSLSSGSGFGSSVTVGAAGLSIAATTVYIRLKSSDAAGTYSGNVILSSTGATSKTIAEYPVTVATQALTITAAAKSKTYGDADPALTYSLTAGALQNGDSFSGALTRAAGTAAGTYAINQGTVAINSNYTIIYIGANLTINAKAIGITAVAASKTYGDADPSFTYTLTSGSLVNGDSFTGSLSRAAGSNVGTYAITQGTVTLGGNYTISYTGANLTITAKSIAIAAAAKSKTYGDTDPALTYAVISGSLVAGDAFTGALTRNSGEAVGTYAITQGSLALTSNYALTYTGANLTIGKKAITVIADAQNKNYGDTDPTLSYTNTSLVSGDSFTGALSRTAGEAVGSYAINQGSLALSANYTLTYTGANLTIGKKTIMVTANAQSKNYGSADPALTYTSTALVSGDSFTGALSRVAGETAGSYVINQGSLALSNNYTLNYTGANLTINQIQLTVTADNQSKFYGDANPALTFGYSGFVNGEGVSILSSAPTISTTADINSAVGSYPIALTGGLATNYSFAYVNATLTIKAHTNADLTNITINNGTLSPSFGTGTLSYTASVNAGINSETITPMVSDATASVTVNGTAVTPSSPSVTLPLSVGSNIINTVVTAQDGVTKKTYTLTVTRATPDLNLTYLTANGNDFEPTFDNSITSYTSAITGYPLATFDFAPEDPTSSISVNGTTIPAGQTYANVPVTPGNNPVSIVVTAQDPAFTKTFNVAVNYSVSNVAQLDALTDSQGGFDQTFDPSVTTYTQTIPYGGTSIAFSPYASRYGSTITINGALVQSGTPSGALPLTLGSNTFTIEVTAQDGVTKKDYTVTITRAKSTDAYLNDLALNGYPFDVPFGYTGSNNYTASVTSSVSFVQVKAVTEDTTARVTIDGNPVTSGSFSANIPVNIGKNVIPVVVTAQDGTTTQSFTITVTRAASTNDQLANLTINTGSLSPGFNSDSTTYNVTVPNGTSNIIFTPTAADPGATITLNNTIVNSGAPVTQYIAAYEGTNQFFIKVTAQDGVTSKTYTVNVTPIPSDANLSALTIGAGTLSPVFDPNTTEYSVSVDNVISTLTITATTHDPLATVSINGGRGTAGTKTKTVNLNGGLNSFAITVRSADNSNQIGYFLNVTRAPSTDATLSGLTLSGTSLSPAFDSGTNSYTASDVNTETVGVTATTTNNGATVTINGSTVTSGSSTPVALMPGGNTIAIAILAQDGSTTDNYTITINRVIPAAPTLSYGGPKTYTSGAAITPFVPAASGVAALAYSATKVVISTALANPTGIATDASGNLFVANVGDGAVYKFAGGSGSGVPFKTGFNTPFNMATDAAGNVFVADAGDQAIEKLPAAGGTQVPFATGQYGNTGVAVDAAGNVYATNANAASLYKVTAGGAVTLNNSLALPYAVAADAKGNLYVADPGAAAVDKLSTNGTLLGTVGSGISYPTDLVTDAQGNIYVTDNNAVKMIPADGSNTVTLASGFNSLFGIALGNSGVIYVTDNGSGTVNRLNPVGGYHITPALPAGLVFNSTTGAISGTPTVISPATNYTVTAYNSGGSTSAVVSIAVAAPSANLSALSISSGTLSPVFDPATLSYTASSPNINVSLTPVAADPGATITVNGTAVASGSASANIALNITGTTTINVAVTAADGITVKTYSLAVTLTGSSDVTAGIRISPAVTLTNTAYKPNENDYTTSVAVATSFITLVATPEAATSSVTVNGVAVANGAVSQPITLNPAGGAPTVVTTVITSQNGNTRAYVIAISRNGSSDVSAGLRLSPASTLTNTAYKAAESDYTTSVAVNTNTITLTATPEDPTSTVTLNGTPLVSGVASQPIALNPAGGAPTMVTAVVTSQNGNTRAYVIAISRNGSSDVNAGIQLNPASTLINTVYGTAESDYTTSVAVATNSITLTATPEDPTSTVTLNGTTLVSGVASQPITLNPAGGAPTMVTAVVTSQSGNTKAYVIAVSRNGSSDLATSIKLSPAATLTNTLFSTTENDYTTSVVATANSVTLTATPEDPTSTVTVNGVAVTSGVASQPIILNPAGGAPTAVTAVVTAQNGGTKSYVIAISRNGSSDVNASIKLSPASTLINTVYGNNECDYTTSVVATTNSVTLTTTPEDPTSTITLNGAAQVSGVASQPITLNPSGGAPTVVAVVVTSQNGNTRAYVIAISRNGSSDVNASIKLNPASTLINTVYGSTESDYTSTVAVATGSITVLTTPEDPTSTVTVNGAAVANGAASPPVTLNAASATPTIVTVTVTAQNGNSRAYVISITRAPAVGLSLTAATNIPDSAPAADDGIIVHQALSPNGDGIDDLFTIEGIAAYPDNKVMIMNRSGVKVFEVSGYNNSNKSFDGHSNLNGSLQPLGTYYYLLEYHVNGALKRKTGFLVIKN